jgi:hypothetical protein
VEAGQESKHEEAEKEGGEREEGGEEGGGGEGEEEEEESLEELGGKFADLLKMEHARRTNTTYYWEESADEAENEDAEPKTSATESQETDEPDLEGRVDMSKLSGVEILAMFNLEVPEADHFPVRIFLVC